MKNTNSNPVYLIIFIILSIAIAIIIAFFLNSCTPPMEYSPYQENDKQVGHNVTRLVDRDAGVVCWVYANAASGLGGIDCIPIQETALR